MALVRSMSGPRLGTSAFGFGRVEPPRTPNATTPKPIAENISSVASIFFIGLLLGSPRLSRRTEGCQPDLSVGYLLRGKAFAIVSILDCRRESDRVVSVAVSGYISEGDVAMLKI